MRRAILPMLVAVLLLPLSGTSLATDAGSSSQDATQSWTIMMYMADDYSVSLPWQNNLAEMEGAGRAAGMNVVALVDPLGNGNSMLLSVQSGSNATIDDAHKVVPPSGEVDMADPGTLRSFVNFSVQTFPADRYVLFLWGHADTWIGMCPDGSDLLTLPELRLGLEGVKSDIGRSLDLVAVDACAVASVEMLFELDGLTQFFVASEKDIPFEGLPYRQILDGLAANPGQSPSDLGSGIVDAYTDWSRYNSTYSSAMAVFNMSRLAQFADSLDVLSVQGAKYDSLFHTSLRGAFQLAEHYETPWYVDCGHLLTTLLGTNLPPELSMAAFETVTRYHELVERTESLDLPGPSDGVHVNHATGAVIYAPSSVLPDTLYANLTVGGMAWYQFGRLVRHDGTVNASEEGPTVTINRTSEAELASVTLQWPAGTGSVQAWVFRNEPGGLVFLGVYADGDGNLTIHGLAGRLLISASSMLGTSAVSYVGFQATVPASVDIRVILLENGEQTTKGYDVEITVEGTIYSLAKDGRSTLALSVPAQGDVNSLLRVRVYDGSGRLVGENFAFLKSADMNITVELSAAGANDSPWPLLGIALLPGFLLLVYAFLLWKGTERKEDLDD